MSLYPYSALSAPESQEQFFAAMEDAAKLAAADHFLVVRLHGSDLAEVARVIHSGGAAADGRLGLPLHWTAERMLDVMRPGGVPKVFGDGGTPGIDVTGFQQGVAALAIDGAGGCVVYLGLRSSPSSDEAMWTLMSTAQLCAQHALSGLERVQKACPLSSRELDCLRHFMANKSTKETARLLGISDRTVEAHLKHARMRCGVEATLTAAVMAINEGWIDLPSVRAIEATG
jgi:DNA-binding CsgD family transcriptional regulator